jgi:hypothetical protein
MLLLLFALVSFVALGSAQAQDKPYFRYWSGYMLDNLTETTLIEGLDWFLNQTASISVCGGLRTYICPMLTHRASVFPDEIALLQYESEALYHKFYATPLGKYYQGLHAQFFNMSKSHSLVPVDFINFESLALNSAYCVPNCDVVWNDFQASHSTFTLGSDVKPLLLMADIVVQIQKISGFKATVFGIYPDYIKITSFWSDISGSAVFAKYLQSLQSEIVPLGSSFEQISENVLPPLNMQFGHTYNVTLGECKMNF